MVGKTNVGGAKPVGYIFVSYPAGSMASILDTNYYTDYTKAVGAETNTGYYVFPVPYAGTWLVACWDGADYDSSTNKKYEIVTISAESPYAMVELSYRLNLYTNGVENVAWTTGADTSILRIKKEADKLRFYTTESVTGAGAQVYTSAAVDLRGHNKLYIKGNSLLSGNLYFGIHTESPAGKYKAQDAVASLNVGGAEGAFERVLDISELNGDFYVNIGVDTYYPANGDHYYVTEVWAI